MLRHIRLPMGQQKKTTSTWYGMFLPTGERLGAVDAMSYAWNGKFPLNRALRLKNWNPPLN